MTDQVISIDEQIKASGVSVLPYSLEAEQSVLGGLMLSRDAWDQVAEQISEKDFYSPENRAIFGVMRQMAEEEKPHDMVTVASTLQTLGQLDKVGGVAYLSELARNTPSAANIASYAEIIRETSILRQIIEISRDLGANAARPKGRTSSALLDDAESKIFAIAEQQKKGSGPRLMKDLLKGTVNTLDELGKSTGAITGMTTGFDKMDEMTSGLQPADMIVVAGRPSMGKTTFAMNICENAAIRSGKPVLIFSMEMPADSLIIRMLSSLGGINQTSLRRGDLGNPDWARISSAVEMLSKQKIFIDDTPALSPLEIRTRARRVARECGGELGIIMVDYLQLMQVPGAPNRVEEISVISRSLKALAKELSVPVIALSQLNRSVDSRPDKRPMMSDLRESGAIEQDADLIVFLYREEAYLKDKTPDELIGKAEAIIGKQRNGPTGTVWLRFEGQFSRFQDMAPEYYEDLAGYE